MTKTLLRYYWFRFNLPDMKPLRRLLRGMLLFVCAAACMVSSSNAWAQETQPNRSLMPHNVAWVYKLGTFAGKKICSPRKGSEYVCMEAFVMFDGTFRLVVLNNASFPIRLYRISADEDDREKPYELIWKANEI